jgi:hypothetical protein
VDAFSLIAHFSGRAGTARYAPNRLPKLKPGSIPVIGSTSTSAFKYLGIQVRRPSSASALYPARTPNCCARSLLQRRVSYGASFDLEYRNRRTMAVTAHTAAAQPNPKMTYGS